MYDFLGDLESNGLSDEINEATANEQVQGLDDYIEKGISIGENLENSFSSKEVSENKNIEIVNPNKDIENSFKRMYKYLKKIENQKIENTKLDNPMEVREFKALDGSHFNDTPNKDIQESFDYVDIMYDIDSPEWQENAVRYVENLEGQLNEISNEYNINKEELNNSENSLSSIITDNELTPENCNSNKDYVSANEKYIEAKNKFEALELKKSSIQSKIDSIKPYIKEESKTIYKGFNNTNFKDSYNAFITNKQGETIEEASGTCSINSEASVSNQQLGTSHTEKSMYNEFKNEGMCTYKEITNDMSDSEKKDIRGSNGGTIYEQRAYMANKHGLSYSAVYGSKASVEQMAKKMDEGYSVKLALKAEDLSQEGLSSRSNKFGIFGGLSNKDINKANHMVTVAGFSYDKDNSIKGVWINDTGGFTGSNRVYIPTEKFNEMSKKTLFFSVEYCKNMNKIDNVDKKSLNVNTRDVTGLKKNELGKFKNIGDFKFSDQNFESNSKVRLEGDSWRTDDNGKIYSHYSSETKTWELVANKYEINGYKYEINDKGQIISVEGNLHLKDHKGRKSISDNIPHMLPGDDKGHLIADMFDGSNKVDNIVPMNSDVNQKEYKSLEMNFKNALQDNKEVYVKIKIKHDIDGRPTRFIVKSEVDGIKETNIFKNHIGGKNNES